MAACAMSAVVLFALGAQAASEACSSPLFATPPIFPTTRWPQLEPYLGRHLHLRDALHLPVTEPLAVAAFAHAVLAEPAGLVLDIGANVGAYASIAGALGARVIAVEMQPGCLSFIKCHLELNNVSTRVRVFNRYVTSSLEHAPRIAVPRDSSSVMASPSAVVGRWPHGLVMKATRSFLKQSAEERSTSASLILPMKLSLEEPALSEELLQSSEANATPRPISMLKIDTEGFEVRVLETARSLWPRVRALVMEIQPFAWKFANVSEDQGLRTLSDLVDGGGDAFLAITLPHAAKADKHAFATIDLCAMKVMDASEPIHIRQGFATARMYPGTAIVDLARRMLRAPRRMGYFNEVFLLRRSSLERCAQKGVAGSSGGRAGSGTPSL